MISTDLFLVRERVINTYQQHCWSIVHKRWLSSPHSQAQSDDWPAMTFYQAKSLTFAIMPQAYNTDNKPHIA